MNEHQTNEAARALVVAVAEDAKTQRAWAAQVGRILACDSRELLLAYGQWLVQLDTSVIHGAGVVTRTKLTQLRAAHLWLLALQGDGADKLTEQSLAAYVAVRPGCRFPLMKFLKFLRSHLGMVLHMPSRNPGDHQADRVRHLQDMLRWVRSEGPAAIPSNELRKIIAIAYGVAPAKADQIGIRQAGTGELFVLLGGKDVRVAKELTEIVRQLLGRQFGEID